MAEASSSRREGRVDESPSSDFERKTSGTSSRRRNHYGSQRVSRPTTGGSQATSKSRGKRASYDEPANFANLDETAAPPPIENPDDRATYRRQSNLEETHQSSRTRSKTPKQAKSGDRHKPVRKRRSVQDEEGDLTEVAAPPPVSQDQEAGSKFGHQQFLEDAEREEEDSDSSEPPYRPRTPQHYLPDKEKESEVSKYLTELYTISYLIFFAILGTLARLGTQWLTYYPGTIVVTPVIWANFAGSLIMGFLSEDQALFRDDSVHEKVKAENGNAEKQRRGSSLAEELDQMAKTETTKRKKAIPLYIGLATGFCGSYTSFSSFARDFFLALANLLPTPIEHPHPGQSMPSTSTTISRQDGYSVEAFLHVVVVTIALSLGGLIAGAHLAIFLDPITPRIHGSFVPKVLDRLMVPLAFGCWLGAILLAIWPPKEVWRGQAIFALVFAPLGCLLRFYASLKLNGLVPAFPLGTFAVNMLGTAVEGMCFDIQHVGVGIMGRVGGGVIGCQVLQGVLDGFCGCLTTISTWVSEINGLKRKHGWAYAFGSVFGGLCLMLIIMGSVAWSVGYENEACNTGYVSKIHG